MLAKIQAKHLEEAILEYDELGRDAFLGKYGYGRSRTYVLEHNGRAYDSKAIVGVAHRFLVPGGRALRPGEFSGGADTVAKLLRARGFVVNEAVPNQSGWTAEERILALDLYFKIGVQSSTHPDVIALSEELNRRAFHPDAGTRGDFRNANGVNLKLANFASLDPSYSGRGMAAASIGDEQTWDRFSGDRDLLAEAVKAIRSGERASQGSVAQEAQVIEIRPLEAQHTDSYEVTREPNGLARRTEADLVLAFGEWLMSQGRQVSSHWYRIITPPLRTDLVDDTERRIWEAKGSPSRSSVRMAVGQLLDYRRLETVHHSIGVLLPSPPSADLLDLLESVGSAVAWRTGESEEPFKVHGDDRAFHADSNLRADAEGVKVPGNVGESPGCG